jgi:hypothetical protein
MGVDVGWQGDESVISFRRGFDCRSISAIRLRVDPEGLFQPDPARISPAAAVSDFHRCRWLRWSDLQPPDLPIIGVNFGGRPEGYTKVDCANRKAELYMIFREHLGLWRCHLVGNRASFLNANAEGPR